MCVAITFPANPELPEAVHDRPVLIVGGVYVGDAEEGMAAMQPLRELGTPLFDMSGPTPYVGRADRRSTRCSRATRCARTGSRSTSTSSPTRRSTSIADQARRTARRR